MPGHRSSLRAPLLCGMEPGAADIPKAREPTLELTVTRRPGHDGKVLNECMLWNPSPSRSAQWMGSQAIQGTQILGQQIMPSLWTDRPTLREARF